MSLHEYQESRAIEGEGFSFYGLVMAAMRQADTENASRLEIAFPDQWAELKARYNAPGGLLPGEEDA